MKSDLTNPLQRSTPEAQGVHSENITAFLTGLKTAAIKMHSFMLLRHGQVIAEGWWQPFAPDCKTYVYSLSKSFTSSAIGFAVTEGLLTVEDKVISFFPEDLPENISENLAAMRVKDLLTMTSGHAVDTITALADPGVTNWVKAILAIPVEYKPGTHFLYNSGASYLLAAIVQKVTGQTPLDYLTPRLFQPLAISDITWETCPHGINTGGWGLSIRTEDIAKFGLLYLQNGQWQDEQILPAEWIQEATALHSRNDQGERKNEPDDWRQGYGYQFWRSQHNAYRGDGAFGQYCVVLPDQDAVLVMTSETNVMQGILDLVWQHLLPAMQPAPLPEPPEAQKHLHELLTSLRVVTPSPTELPSTAASYSGKTFKMKANHMGISSVSFDFSESGCSFRLHDAAGKHVIRCGNGKWINGQGQMMLMKSTMIQLGSNQTLKEPVRIAAVGSWKNPNTYIITWQYLETPHLETLTCTFEGNSVTLQWGSSLLADEDPRLELLETQFSGTLE